MLILAELHDFRRCGSARALMALLGLVPGENSSGEKHRRGRITEMGNALVRRILVVTSWHYQHRPGVGRALTVRRTGQPPRVIAMRGQGTTALVPTVPTDAGRAQAAGGTGTSSLVGVNVNYTMSWAPPLSKGNSPKGGRSVAIRFAARDCLNSFVTDTSVRVEVWEASELRFEAEYGVGSEAVRIEPDRHYIANLKTASGVHTYEVKVFFSREAHQGCPLDPHQIEERADVAASVGGSYPDSGPSDCPWPRRLSPSTRARPVNCGARV